MAASIRQYSPVSRIVTNLARVADRDTLRMVHLPIDTIAEFSIPTKEVL
jgi:hypothetical protein